MPGSGKNIAIGCASVAILIVLALVFLVRSTSEPTDVEVLAQAPLEVRLGERFTILARAKNTATKEQVLVDLDIADSYLEGIAIERSEPPFSGGFHVPIDNTFSYSFDLPIAAQGEVAVTLHAYAAHVGDFSGDIDFCINSDTQCTSYPIRTIVGEARR